MIMPSCSVALHCSGDIVAVVHGALANVAGSPWLELLLEGISTFCSTTTTRAEETAHLDWMKRLILSNKRGQVLRSLFGH